LLLTPYSTIVTLQIDRPLRPGYSFSLANSFFGTSQGIRLYNLEGDEIDHPVTETLLGTYFLECLDFAFEERFTRDFQRKEINMPPILSYLDWQQTLTTRAHLVNPESVPWTSQF
jgi:hypothetical protein